MMNTFKGFSFYTAILSMALLACNGEPNPDEGTNSDLNMENISDFNGIALVHMNQFSGPGGINLDSSFVERIEFEYDSDDIKIQSEFNNFSFSYEFNFIDEDLGYRRYGFLGSPANTHGLDYYYEKDSISLARRSGGLGSGIIWTTSITK